MRLSLYGLAFAAFLGTWNAATAQGPASQPVARPQSVVMPYLPPPPDINPVIHRGQRIDEGYNLAGGPVVASGQGCTSCGETGTASRASLLGSVRIRCGCAMPLGCASLQAEKSFLFGSCRQFFNPGGSCGPRAHLYGGCSQTGMGICNGCGALSSEPPHLRGGGSFLNR